MQSSKRPSTKQHHFFFFWGGGVAFGLWGELEASGSQVRGLRVVGFVGICGCRVLGF